MEGVKSLLFRPRDKRALFDCEFRVVNEWVRQVVVLRPKILFLLLIHADMINLDAYTRFPHLRAVLLTTSIGTQARFRRTFTVSLAFVPLHRRRW